MASMTLCGWVGGWVGCEERCIAWCGVSMFAAHVSTSSLFVQRSSLVLLLRAIT